LSPILSDKKPFAWGVLPLHYVLKIKLQCMVIYPHGISSLYA